MEEVKFFTENKHRAPTVTDPTGLLQTVAAALPGLTFNPKPAETDTPIANANAMNTTTMPVASQAPPPGGPQQLNYYISAINTKRNPDLIIPGGAIKGNMYFRRHVQTVGESSQVE